MASDTDSPTSSELSIPTVAESLVVRFFTCFVHQQGTYFRFHNLARGLAARGHRVTVHASDQNWRSSRRTEIRDGIEYDIVPESRPIGPLAAPMHPSTAVRRTRNPPPQCDVAHLFQPFLSPLGAWWRTPASIHVSDSDELWAGGLFPPRRFLTRPQLTVLFVLERGLFRYAPHHTVVSHWLADKAQAWGARGTPEIIYMGYTPRDLQDKAQARAELGLERDALYLGYIGRTANQFEWCFEAMEEAVRRDPSVRMAVAGTTKQLVEVAPAAIRGHIDYLGDLSPEHAALCADAIDIGLLPMQDDTWNRSRLPTKFADYLSAGLHVVCSSVGECGQLGAVLEQVVPAGTTSPEWVAAVQEAIDRCSRLPWPRRTQLGGEELSWPAIAEKLEGYYLTSLRTGGSRVDGPRPRSGRRSSYGSRV